MKGKAMRGNFLAFGDYGLQALEAAWITKADRIGPDRHHSPREAGRQDLDQDFSGQALHQKTGGNPHGER